MKWSSETLRTAKYVADQPANALASCLTIATVEADIAGALPGDPRAGYGDASAVLLDAAKQFRTRSPAADPMKTRSQIAAFLTMLRRSFYIRLISTKYYYIRK